MVDVTPVVSDVTDPPSMLPRHDIQELRSLKQEMDARGSLLGRTWSELSGIMDKYQARLLEKHDQVEFKAVPVDHQKYETLEKRVSDLEQKLLAKDSEIVELRTAVHQYKNEVRMKDNLIEKIQNQMAKEAMEFQTEISSLRDMLERRENGGGEANIGATAGLVKRRKIHVNKPVSQAPESSTPVSQPSPSLRLSKPVFPGPEPLFTEASPNYTNMHNQNFPNSANRQRDFNNSKNLTQNFENQNFEIENAEEEEGEESVAERVGVKLEEADEVPEEVYAGLEQAEDEMMLQQVLDTGQGSSGQVDPRAYMDALYQERNFVCRFCQKRFMNKQHLTFHLRIHLGLLPYRCRLCPKRFRQSGTCVRHIKNVHKDLLSQLGLDGKSEYSAELGPGMSGRLDLADPHQFLVRDEQVPRTELATMTYNERISALHAAEAYNTTMPGESSLETPVYGLEILTANCD